MASVDLDTIRSLDGYRLIQAMQDLADAAARDDEALQSLVQLLEECQSPEAWKKHGALCSAAIHGLARIGTLRSMQMLLKYVRKLPNETPYGVVELMSTILPTYRRIIVGPVKDLIRDEQPFARAVGLQTFCNLYLDEALQGSDIAFLKEQLNEFKEDDYLTAHVADLVRLEMAYKEKQADEDLAGMLEGMLVESD